MKKRVSFSVSPLNGRFLLGLSILGFVSLMLVIGVRLVQAVTHAPHTGYVFTIDSTGDEGDAQLNDEICATSTGTCTLRAAIEELNALNIITDVHQIRFIVPGTGVQTIQPNTPLPTIAVPTLLEGSYQTGTRCPDLIVEGIPAQLKLILDGANAGPGANGLVFGPNADGSTVRGIAVTHFDAAGLRIEADQMLVECTHLGVDPDGVTAQPNDIGVLITGDDNRIGGNGRNREEADGLFGHGQRNVISGNSSAGVKIDGGGDNMIGGNYIGLSADAETAVGNGVGVQVEGGRDTLIGQASIDQFSKSRNGISGNNGPGVQVIDAQETTINGNLIGLSIVPARAEFSVPNLGPGIDLVGSTADTQIGSPNPGGRNAIATNNGNGVQTRPQSGESTLPVTTTVTTNRFYDNVGLGVDLGNDGVDNGPNDPAYPFLTASWKTIPTDLFVTGIFNADPGQSYTLEFFGNTVCDPSGFGEGGSSRGSLLVTTDANGTAEFEFNIGNGLVGAQATFAGEFVTANATDGSGVTSEFSACIEVADGNPNPVATPTPTPLPILTPEPGQNCNTLAADTQSIFLPAITNSNSSSNRQSAPHLFVTQSDTLLPNSSIEIVDCVMVRSLAGTLSQSIEITSGSTGEPSIPLPDFTTLIGRYFGFQSDRFEYIDPEAPLIISIPVPDDVDTDHLALAILNNNGLSENFGEGGDPRTWILLEGVFTPDDQHFHTTLSFLSEKPRVMALVSNPTVEVIVNPTQGDQKSLTQTLGFKVNCIGPFAGPVTCDPADKTAVQNQLLAVQAEYQDHHPQLKQPRIRRTLLSLEPDGTPNIGYQVYIESDGEGGCTTGGIGRVLGHYLAEDSRFVICKALGDDLSSDLTKRVVVHEYFHAIQYSYSEVMKDRDSGVEEHWIIEGMAAAAMESYDADVMIRTTDYSLHNADRSLKNNQVPSRNGGTTANHYETQDFWVFYGQDSFFGLSYFRHILENGATTDDVVRQIGSSGRLDPYWDYAKNQMFVESNLDFDGALGNRCEFQSGNQIEAHTFAEDTLDPLTTHVVPFVVGGPLLFIRVESLDYVGAGEDPSLKYKIVEQGDSGCWLEPEGERSGDIQVGDKYYILISNIDPHREIRYEIVAD